MRLRYRLAITLSLLTLSLGTMAAHAAKPLPPAEPLSPESVQQFQLGHGTSTNAACVLGVTDPPAWIVNYLAPPDDAYFNLVNPANCACATGAVQLNDIQIYLNFQAACSQPVQISVVGATGASGCFRPDPSNYLCPPLNYNLAPGAAGNYIFTLPLPTGCCINGPAFIGINFIAPGAGCNTSSTQPRLVTTNICNPCVSYNVYPSGFDDLCVDIGFPGNVAMFADADCCGATPSHSDTWGRVKVLYR
ncbi:MAG TPA: hypothetical protein VMJ70_02385 [Candidatus Sulfotelmatobacter sp.]|nr:hypothetical protein [Candidatus Sulfotelmatobacter sp.]